MAKKRSKQSEAERRLIGEYIETWDGEHGYPGFCLIHVLEESGMPLRVERGWPLYLRDHPDMQDWLNVFNRAASNLRAAALAAKRQRSGKSRTGNG